MKELILLLVVFCTNKVNGFSGGAPTYKCGDMTPSHGAPNGAQTGTSPYTLSVTQANGAAIPEGYEYSAGQKFKVTITPNAGSSFKGFLLKARSTDTNNQASGLGTFSSTNNNVKTITCDSGGTRNPGSTLDLSDCQVNKDKGCFTFPSGCIENCDMAVTWTQATSGDGFNFEMSSKQDYVVLGFSTDKDMGDDAVIDCINNKQTSVIQAGNSENQGYGNSARSPYTEGITDQVAGETNGEIRCRFTHSGVIGNKNINTEKYFLFLGGGSTSGAVKNKHSATPFISHEEVKLSRYEFVGGSELKPLLLRLHGSFMIIAWIMCASIGIMMARYYKDAWPKSYLLLGTNVWFTIHRILMVIVVTLTIIAFILIFVHVEGYSDMSLISPKILRAHPILGIIVTALAILNPIMALFRPGPTSDNRVYFNWAHWGVGTIAHVAAVITVFLGLRLPQSAPIAPDHLLWVMIAYIAFHIAVDIMLEVHKCMIKNDEERDFLTSGNINSNYDGNVGKSEMEMQQPGESPASRPSNGSGFRKIVLAVYILVVVVLGLFLVITILSR